MKILLVIDLQRQFKAKGYDECLEYIEAHRNKYDLVIASLFVNNRRNNSNYIKKLKYSGCTDADIYDLEFKADQIYVKNGYSFPSRVFKKSDKIDIIGCETDACVLATCFTLWDEGIDFNVIWDHIYTSADIEINELKKLYKRNFGI